MADGTNETLWAVDMTTYSLAPALAGLTLDPTKGVVAGGLYWNDTVNEDEVPIGCATVKAFLGSNETGEARYFGDNRLPTKLTNQAGINAGNGYFLSANINPGQVDVKGFYPDGTEIGSTTVFSVAGAICISNIYVDGTSNPSDETGNCL